MQYSFIDVLLTVHFSIFISVINQLDTQNFGFTINLFHASTCFEHMYPSSGGQNCITQPLVSSNSVSGRLVHRLREDSTRAPDGHLYSYTSSPENLYTPYDQMLQKCYVNNRHLEVKILLTTC